MMESNIPDALPVQPQKKRRFLLVNLNFWQREILAFYGFISPWLIGFIVLSMIPLAFAAVIGFTNYGLMDSNITKFVGLTNYQEAIQDPEAYRSFWLTCQYTALSVSIGLAVALGLALLLNLKIPARGFFRTLYYLPSMVPLVATAMVFNAILNRNSGFINFILSALAGRGIAIDWINKFGIPCLVGISLWGCGINMVIFLASLQGIPEELREAAEIDGAGKWQVFRHITWPLLSPITFYLLMMGIIGSMQMFQLAGILNQINGGFFWTPAHSLIVYPGYAMMQIFEYGRFGYGTALIWILFVIILILAVVMQKVSTRWVFDAMDPGREAKEK